MNWMIDGANGDLYRTAMGYSQLQNARDEWDIERNLGRKPHPHRPLLTALRGRLTAAFARLAAAFQRQPAAQEKLS